MNHHAAPEIYVYQQSWSCLKKHCKLSLNGSKTCICEHIMSELVCALSPQYLHLTVSSMQVFKVVYLAILLVIGCLRSKDQLHQFGEVMSACIHLSGRSIPANINQGCRMWCAHHRKLHRTYLEYHCCKRRFLHPSQKACVN